MSMVTPNRIIIMGVAGSGKTSVGTALAAQIDATYLDGDDLHSQKNIEKMCNGISLTDEDRLPWLREVGIKLRTTETTLIIGCSALRYAYRLLIAEEAGFPITFIYLAGSREVIATRMASRTGHFMPTQLLDSQFEALEEPFAHEKAIRIDIEQSLNAVVAQAVAFLQLPS